MRRSVFVLFLIAVAWMAGDHPAATQQDATDSCPLRWRKDPEAAARAREGKKQRMRDNGVPERYLHLLDKMECVACIETAPDTLHITVIYNDDEHAPTLSTGQRDLKVEFKWSAQSERQLREELRNGQIQSFYVWIHEKRCYCCPDFDQKAEDDQDWDDDTGLNMDEAEEFDDPSDLGPLPDDLKGPPPGSQVPPPPIERFDDLPRPTRRVLQATCQACEALASQWTNESNNLNFLWDRKIEQMRRVSVIANARANRSNEIQKLEYEQRFNSTRTYDNLQKIKELKEVNEAQEGDQDKAEQEIDRLEEQIRETELRMEELMQRFLECEKSCKKTTTTAADSVANAGTPVVADAPAAAPEAPQAMPAPQGATAACPDCTAHAQRIADLQKSMQAHQAESGRHRDAIARNSTNISNLTQMRSEAAARGDAPRVLELEGRITELQNSSREHRAEQFKHNEEITALTEQIEASQRDLEACNSQCVETGAVRTGTAGSIGASSGRAAPRRFVAVDPLPPLPDCKECEALVRQLRSEHQRLVDMAERANDTQLDIDDAEEQRAKVDALKKEIEKCKCPTTTASNNTTRVNSGGMPVANASGVTGVPADTPVAPGANPQAACPDCTAQAQRIADLQESIRAHQAESGRHRDAINRNNVNIDNLTQMCAQAATAGAAARVAELEGRISDLQNSNRQHRAEQFKHSEEITALTEQIAAAQRNLEACNSQCTQKGLVPNTGAAGDALTGMGTTRRFIAVDPLPPLPECKECESTVRQLRAEHRRLQDMAERANNTQRDFDDAEEQRAKVEALKRELEKCKCPTTTDNATANAANSTGAAGGQVAVNDNSGDGIRVEDRDTRLTDGLSAADRNSGYGVVCSGPDCADEWAACSATNSCAPIDRDCGVPGTCSFQQPAPIGRAPLVNLASSPNLFQVANNIRVDDAIQNKFLELPDWHPLASTNTSSDYGYPIPPVGQPQARWWLNPLGLLARRIVDNIEHWRGSFSHRPSIDSRDVDFVGKSLGSQSAGLATGVHVLLTDRGGSTGKTLTLQVLNLTGQPVRLGAMPFAIEPLRREASRQVQQAFGRLARSTPATFDVAAYCVDFLKLPPQANTIFRLAPAPIQKQYEAMSKVLRSAYRVQQAGLLQPDSNPAAYTDSIKQWAVWTVEQRFNESRFTEAFIGHTRKNVEAAGQQWPRQAEEMIRKAAPNRWRDIVKIVSGAGLPVPQ